MFDLSRYNVILVIFHRQKQLFVKISLFCYNYLQIRFLNTFFKRVILVPGEV